MCVNTGKSTAVKSKLSSDGKVGVKWILKKYNNNSNNNEEYYNSYFMEV